VLVVFEGGPAGVAALDYGRELAEQDRATLSVVSVAPQEPLGMRCGGSPSDYNRAVRDAVAHELEQARARLGEIGANASFELLVEGRDLPLQDWCVMGAFDLILLPAHRRPLRAPSHPAAAAVKRTGVQVRIVDRRGRRLTLT
jgi:nucleotide-binding universal stress UspA family protein